ncbi:hypothetical protein SynBIOSE41_02074 [Synechococcus sp. BIOS-E4-1]|nr:hypothetical protein SynBIOSE41_02074 [Synechococcus sp. BIOS-E4-1]
MLRLSIFMDPDDSLCVVVSTSSLCRLLPCWTDIVYHRIP